MFSDLFSDYKKSIVIGSLIALLFITMFTTYATLTELEYKNVSTELVGIDEEAYGNNVFDNSNLVFSPILDKDVNKINKNVIYIDFRVGGNKENDDEANVYDIALMDLEVDCELLSPYLKWKLLKNGMLISEGSLDYKFDTIKKGRLVLTPIQQDLKKYSEDKNTYDYYEFYMWVSDSLQSENLLEYEEQELQNNLINKKLKGKIEVQLYGSAKKELVREPSEVLDTNTCIVGGDANEY